MNSIIETAISAGIVLSVFAGFLIIISIISDIFVSIVNYLNYKQAERARQIEFDKYVKAESNRKVYKNVN